MKELATAVALALVLALGAVLVLPGTAMAHGDEATLAVESQESTGPLALDLQISARYTNDDELVESINLSVTGTGPSGETLAPTPMTLVPETLGLYEASLAFPTAGVWSLRVTGTEPAAAIDVSVPVEEAAETTTTAAEETTSTTAQPIGDEDGDVVEDDSDLLPIVGGVLAVLVIGGVVVAVVLRRRKAANIDDAV